MSNEFDLEKARAGELVEYLGSREWEACKVLGVSESPGNLFVVERVNRNGFRLAYAKADDLRMAPKKARLRYRIALCKYGPEFYPVAVGSNDAAFKMENVNSEFVEWIHADWQEVEITSESA